MDSIRDIQAGKCSGLALRLPFPVTSVKRIPFPVTSVKRIVLYVPNVPVVLLMTRTADSIQLWPY